MRVRSPQLCKSYSSIVLVCALQHTSNVVSTSAAGCCGAQTIDNMGLRGKEVSKDPSGAHFRRSLLHSSHLSLLAFWLSLSLSTQSPLDASCVYRCVCSSTTSVATYLLPILEGYGCHLCASSHVVIVHCITSSRLCCDLHLVLLLSI